MNTNAKRLKWLLFLLNFIALSTSICAAAETNGFLVFEIARNTYSQNNGKGSNVQQRFKVPLTEEFMSNFKHAPSQNSTGTGLWCSGGNLNPNEGATRFMWWIHQTQDQRWSVNMWGEGTETIKGIKINSGRSASQWLTIKRLEDLDMGYMLSYASDHIGRNISFTAKFMSAKDINARGSIPAAPVQKADHTELFKGDRPGNFPLEIKCGFQD